MFSEPFTIKRNDGVVRDRLAGEYEKIDFGKRMTYLPRLHRLQPLRWLEQHGVITLSYTTPRKRGSRKDLTPSATSSTFICVGS